MQHDCCVNKHLPTALQAHRFFFNSSRPTFYAKNFALPPGKASSVPIPLKTQVLVIKALSAESCQADKTGKLETTDDTLIIQISMHSPDKDELSKSCRPKN